MIYTSRYSNKELREGRYYPVGISVGKPKFNLGYELRDQCYALAPRYNMLEMAQEPYRVEYFKKLYGTGVRRIIDIINGFNRKAEAEGKDLVLLCYEDIRDPDKWCHRTMFAEWWEKNTGEKIEELPDPTPAKIAKKHEKAAAPEVKEPEAEQMSLFGNYQSWRD